MIGRVLVVAGSDSGGGAGIQADIKTLTILGVHATTAITAITAQNTLGVSAVLPVPADFVRRQMSAALTDIGADAIKTGMLLDAQIIKAVAEEIAASAPGVPIVVDPVMLAKGGARLLATDATAALLRHLLPRTTVLTPNLPEAEVLLGRPIMTLEDMRESAAALLELGPKNVLLKGGHLPGPMVHDVLATPAGLRVFSAERINSQHTHGTGCTLASAIAAGLAQQLGLVDAIERARAYVRAGILNAPGLGRGQGPLGHRTDWADANS